MKMLSQFFLLVLLLSFSLSLKTKGRITLSNKQVLNVGNRVSFESANFPGHYLRHFLFEIHLHAFENSDLYKKDATFIVRPALNGRPGYLSFESVNYPGKFIRHSFFLLFIHTNDNSPLFREDASFRVVGPNNGRPGFSSLEAANFPNFFWRHQFFRGKLAPREYNGLYNDDSSFKIVPGLDQPPQPQPQPQPQPEPEPEPVPEVENMQISGDIVDASTGLAPSDLTGATLTFTNSDGAVFTATITDGSYSVELPAGEYEREFACPDYISGKESVTIAEGSADRLLVSKVVKGYKVVLTWENDYDLDLYVSNGGEFVMYSNTSNSSGTIHFDVDDTDGHGPETITIGENSGKSRVIVARYGGGDLKDSKASIKIFHGDQLEKTINLPDDVTTVWKPVEIDADAQTVTEL